MSDNLTGYSPAQEALLLEDIDDMVECRECGTVFDNDWFEFCPKCETVHEEEE